MLGCQLADTYPVLQAKRLNVVTDESEQEFGGVMLELDLLEDSGQLMGTLGYNVDLFKESTVMRIAQQFQVCLRCLELWTSYLVSPSQQTGHLPARRHVPACRRLTVIWLIAAHQVSEGAHSCRASTSVQAEFIVVLADAGCHMQAMLEAFVQSGPSAPVAGLPVMSELLKRMADLDEEEAEAICSLGTPVQQVVLCAAPTAHSCL